MGYTGFTLVMPFLPLFIGQLGVTDVGEIAMWTGLSLGVTPALTALLAPAWGRLGDRFGRKIMVERSLVSFVVLIAAMAFVTRAGACWRCARCRGCSRATDRCRWRWRPSRRRATACRRRSALVQTAQRIGPGVGPVIGGVLRAGWSACGSAFLATAAFYAVALVIVHVLVSRRPRDARAGARTRRRRAA